MLQPEQSMTLKDNDSQVKSSIFDIKEAITFLTLNKSKEKNEEFVFYEASEKSFSKQNIIRKDLLEPAEANEFSKNIYTNMNNQSFKRNKNFQVKPINIIKNNLSPSSNNLSTPSPKCAWSSNLDDTDDDSEHPKSSSSSFLFSSDNTSEADILDNLIGLEKPICHDLTANNPIKTLAQDNVKKAIPEYIPKSLKGLTEELLENLKTDCSKCLASSFTYTHYFAQGSKYLKIEVVDPPNPKLKNKQSRQYARASSVKHKNYNINKDVHNLNEKEPISANNKQRPCHKHFDTFSIDLTGSNVTYTVEQHLNHRINNTRQSSNINGYQYNNYQTRPNYYNQYNKNPLQTFVLPYLSRPRYCLVPIYYVTYPNLNNRNNLYYINKYVSKSKPTSVINKNISVTNKNTKPVNNQSVECTPPLRPWITLNKLETGKPVAIFSVMCYNVLCENYATRNLYSYCPSWALSWDQRKKRILQEILLYAADIVNLQEVETAQFVSFFEPEMRSNGYESIFCPKSRAHTMSDSKKQRVDGCAIFFKSSKYRLLKEHMVEFNKMAVETAEGSHEMINRVMTKDNIGLAALLETKEKLWENGQPELGEKQFLVATCHIHWDPEYSDVKLIQTMMLMNRLKEIAEENNNLSLPLILCGDLNSLPDSGVVEYLSKGCLNSSHKDFKDFAYTSSLRRLSVSSRKDVYFHAFNLKSAYSPTFMPFSSYTPDFQGMIDYVFYSSNWMTPLGVLGALDPQWFVKNNIQGCPNPQIPSDHLPLLVEFQFFPEGINTD